MLSIRNNIVNEFIIKKSRFITFLFRVDNVDDVNKYLDDLSIKYKDATHICYAYIIGNIKRFSDNGEPGGTAGMPILSVLENKKIDHILCCVVRYFGGIKLGANGLVRAYSSSCNEAIDCSSVVELIPGCLCNIIFNYDDTKTVDSLLVNSNIISKKYYDKVSYDFKIDSSYLDGIKSELIKYCELKIIDNCYIEKDI